MPNTMTAVPIASSSCFSSWVFQSMVAQAANGTKTTVNGRHFDASKDSLERIVYSVGGGICLVSVIDVIVAVVNDLLVLIQDCDFGSLNSQVGKK